MKTYFISDGRYTKIGKSTDPDARLAHLQTSHHAQLQMIAVTDGDHEHAYHKLFAAQRRRGEWFELDEEQVALIRALVRPSYNRCMGVDDHGKRCTQPQHPDLDGFCPTCPIGPALYLSDASYRLLARSEWETIDEAQEILNQANSTPGRLVRRAD